MELSRIFNLAETRPMQPNAGKIDYKEDKYGDEDEDINQHS